MNSSEIEFVYVFGPLTWSVDATVKIGFTTNPKARLQNLETASVGYVFWHLWLCPGYGVHLEKALHTFFASKCIKREFFLLGYEDICFLDELPFDDFEYYVRIYAPGKRSLRETVTNILFNAASDRKRELSLA